MKPIDFDESNFTYTAPKGMPDCGDLKVYKDDTQIISCWEMSPEEKIDALFFGKVWLYITGQAQPPVALVAAPSVFVGVMHSDFDETRKATFNAFINRKAEQFMENQYSFDVDTKVLLADFLTFALGINSIAETEEKV